MAEKPSETVGRPSIFTEDASEEICRLIIEGESLRSICAMESMPSRSTVLRWLHDNPDFEAKCARARLMQADLMDDKILDAAEACDEGNYQSTKVKIAAYQWRAEKLNAKKYGVRPAEVNVNVGLTMKTDAELDAKIAEFDSR